MSKTGKRNPAAGTGKPVAVQPYDYFEEKRKYPRIVVDRDAEIRIGTTVLHGVIHDLSPDGLQLRCDRETMRAIHPSGKSIKGEKGPLIKIVFTLPLGAGEKSVAMDARMYYFVLLPDAKPNDVAFGARFTAPAGAAKDNLDAFIHDALQPIEDAIVALLDEPRTATDVAGQLHISQQRAAETLAKLKDTHQFLELQSGNQVQYVQLTAALRLLFKRVADLDRRLQKLEAGSGRG